MLTGVPRQWSAGENQVAACRWPAYAVRVKQRRKRHHYLPESYLKAWAGERGQVAVRRRDQPDAFCTTTRNVAVEADLYALPTDAGLDDALEVALSEIEACCRDTWPGCATGPLHARGARRGRT